MKQAGTYNANLKRGVLGKAKSGSIQAALIFDVTAYYDGNAWADIEPFERTVFLSFSGGAKEYTKKKLATLGYTEPKVEKEGDEQVMVFPEGTGDVPVSLLCKEEQYQGSPVERWDFANWGGGVTGESANDDDALKFAAMW